MTVLTLYVFLVKQDMSILIGIVIVVIVAFVCFGITFAFTMSGALHTLWGTFGVILGGIYLVVDMNMIADGDRGCSMDDPWLGALILYIDIMRIFLYMLQALGGSKR